MQLELQNLIELGKDWNPPVVQSYQPGVMEDRNSVALVEKLSEVDW